MKPSERINEIYRINNPEKTDYFPHTQEGRAIIDFLDEQWEVNERENCGSCTGEGCIMCDEVKRKEMQKYLDGLKDKDVF